MAEFEIRPSLHLDLSFLSFTSTTLPSSAFSSLTPVSSPVHRSTTKVINNTNPFDSSTLNHEPSSYFNISPSSSGKIVRPGLQRSHFSSFCAEPDNESVTLEGSVKEPGNEGRLHAQSGWRMAQRLRDAALSDWESQRTVKPAFLVSRPPTTSRSLSPGHR